MKKLFLSLLLLVTTLHVGAQQPVKFDHEVIGDGAEKTIVFYAEIENGYYMYSTDIPKGGPMPITIRITESKGVEMVGNLEPVYDAQTKYESAFNMNVNYFSETAEFEQKFKALGGSYEIKGYLRYQACGTAGCIPARYEFTISGEEVSVTPSVTPSVSEPVVSTLTVVEEVVAPVVTVVPSVESATVAENSVVESVVPVAPVAEPVTVAENAVVDTVKTVVPAVESAIAVENIVTDSVEATVPVVEVVPTANVVAPTEVNDTVPAPPTPTNSESAEIDTWAPVGELKNFSAEEEKDSLWGIFFAGLIAGLAALVTPCVWPIIPMTVSFFLKRSKERKQAVKEAYIYGASIIVIYVTLGLLVASLVGAAALNNLATNAYFNVFFFLMLLVFGASFLGGFEIKLPSSWTNKIDSKASSTTGMLSVFFMAFTLVLVSFSCTGPFVGTLLVGAATSGDIFAPAIGMFGFALALALPFTIFAMFPSLLKKTPRSGGWMNTIKVVLGFAEIALSLKFLSVADLTQGWGILDRETFLALWIIIFTLLGLYLLKIIRLPHDDPEDKTTSVPGLFTAVVSLSFAVYMIPGLWGAPCKAISAFAPPMWTQDFNLDKSEESVASDYDEAIKLSREHKKPIFLEFTGLGCVNCRKMEASVFSDRNVLQKLHDEFVVAKLYVDNRDELPEPFVGKDGSKHYDVGEKWTHLQQYKFGAVAQPYYVILDSNGKSVTEYYFAYDEDVEKFLEFLELGLENFNKKK